MLTRIPLRIYADCYNDQEVLGSSRRSREVLVSSQNPSKILIKSKQNPRSSQTSLKTLGRRSLLLPRKSDIAQLEGPQPAPGPTASRQPRLSPAHARRPAGLDSGDSEGLDRGRRQLARLGILTRILTKMLTRILTGILTRSLLRCQQDVTWN